MQSAVGDFSRMQVLYSWLYVLSVGALMRSKCVIIHGGASPTPALLTIFEINQQLLTILFSFSLYRDMF